MYGLLGAIDDRVGVLRSPRATPAAGARSSAPSNTHRVDLVLVPARDEPLLERERPGRRDDERPQPVVGRRQEARREPGRRDEPRGHGRERLAAPERLRAHEMEPEVEVAEQEPALAAPAPRRTRAPATSRPRGPSRARRRSAPASA